jgi:hypothetical protein
MPQTTLRKPHLHGAPAGSRGPLQRKATQLVTALRAIGSALGGKVGARRPPRLRLSTSSTTLLHLVRAALVSRSLAHQAVGVEEWAWRRGRRLGTIVVNFVDHRVVDLLPERSAATMAAWFAQHPTIPDDRRLIARLTEARASTQRREGLWTGVCSYIFLARSAWPSC